MGVLIDLIPDLAGEAEEMDRHHGAVDGYRKLSCDRFKAKKDRRGKWNRSETRGRFCLAWVKNSQNRRVNSVAMQLADLENFLEPIQTDRLS
jgi:hypothetical protein